MWTILTSKQFLSKNILQNLIRNYQKGSISNEVVSELRSIVGSKNIFTSDAVCEQHGHDESPHTAKRADVVVKPESTEQVSNIAKILYNAGVPMIPFGAGSGFEGGVIPVQGGVSIDMTKMNNVLAVHAEDFDVVVEPGVTRKSLNTYLRDSGLWFPVDPGADATLGGMSSTSASGTNAVRYGTMRENVLNLEVVLSDGTVINTAGNGNRPRKTSAGYNLTNLFVGSEGTLGIFTKVTLRLYAIPESIISGVCPFPNLEAAVTTAIQILQANIPIARVELLDTKAMEACNRYSKFSYKETPTLFFELHGSPKSVEDQSKMATEISVENGANPFRWTSDADERNRLWAARHSLLYAVMALRPGSRFVSSDVCVPISKLNSVIKETHDDIDSQGIIGPILGHVGDGNFHAFMLFDPNNHEELKTIKGLCDRMAKRAWAVNGTCTGEHGIGLGKTHLLETEIGQSGFNVMKQIKRTIDPKNIMNPGKVLPELVQIVGEKNVCVSDVVRKQHGTDEGYHKGFPADVVVKPETTDQVSHIAKLCHKNRIPMIPFGVGSGLEGGVIPIKGGVTINMTEMNEILQVNPDDFDVTIQPGVLRKALNNYLRDTGLWFPIDPGADASIGGMASTSASGTNAVRYGTMRENVLNMEVVLADGTIINTAGKRRRPRFRARVYSCRNKITSAVCSFPTVETAVRTAIQTLQTNVPIARVELLDEVAIKACNAYSKLTHDEVPTLFMEFHGQEFEVEEQLKAVREIAINNGGTGFVSSNVIEERHRLWTARHKLFYAILALRPGCKAVVSDVCVPLSKLPHIVTETQRDIRDNGITGAILGHVGDGNFHAVMDFDPNNFEELNTIKGISDRLVRRAWAVDGTCTGEHGIGLGKIHLLEGEIGRTGVHIMRQIKEALDPYNIMNPGKILHL